MSYLSESNVLISGNVLEDILSNYPSRVGFGVGTQPQFGMVTAFSPTNAAQTGHFLQTEFDSLCTVEGNNIRVDTYSVAGSYTTPDVYIVNLSPINKGAGHTITNLYGLFIGDVNAGTNNRAIKTGLGIIDFGDIVLTPATTTARASMRLPHGTAPSAPVNGDMWTTTAGLFVRINNVTVGPLS